MPVVTIAKGQLAATIRSSIKRNKRAIGRGIRMAAERGAAYLASKTPVDEGVMKNAWKVWDGSIDGLAARIVNSAPHAGIIEAGARPHGVSEEGQAALRAWVERVMGGTPDEVNAVVWGIIAKLKEKGYPGLHIVLNAMDKLREFADKEINRQLSKAIASTGDQP